MAKVCFMCNTAAWIFSAQPFLVRGALLLRRLYARTFFRQSLQGVGWPMLGKVEILYKIAVKNPVVSDGVLEPPVGCPYRGPAGPMLGNVEILYTIVAKNQFVSDWGPGSPFRLPLAGCWRRLGKLEILRLIWGSRDDRVVSLEDTWSDQLEHN